MTPTPLQTAEWRLQAAAGTADERDRCEVRAPDVRLLLAELARLQQWEVEQTQHLEPGAPPARVHPQVGCCVTFVDLLGVPHAALVTAVWGSPLDICQPAVNLCHVSTDAGPHDQAGSREVLYEASVVHHSMQSAPGNYWRWEDEE